MMTKSRQARKQKNLIVFVPLQFVFVGLVIDFIAKTFPIIAIISVILGIAWAMFFPKIYDKWAKKTIGTRPDSEGKLSKINVEIFDEVFHYFIGKKATPSEIFQISEISGLKVSDENYFLEVEKGKSYVLFPKDNASDEILAELFKTNPNIPREEISLD